MESVVSVSSGGYTHATASLYHSLAGKARRTLGLADPIAVGIVCLGRFITLV